MKIESRLTHSFIDLKVDEIETTIFNSSQKEIQETIENLLSVIEDLANLNGKELSDYLNKEK